MNSRVRRTGTKDAMVSCTGENGDDRTKEQEQGCGKLKILTATVPESSVSSRCVWPQQCRRKNSRSVSKSKDVPTRSSEQKTGI